MSFQFDIVAGEKGLLWAFCEISRTRASGILTIAWEKFQKQIIFRRGEPIAIKSNWNHESLGNFLIRTKAADAEKIRHEVLKREAQSSQEPLGECLVRLGILDAAQMPAILEAHFRERVFNIIALTHGKINFQSSEQLIVGIDEEGRLNENFLKLLLEAVRTHFNDSLCKTWLAPFLKRSARLEGDCPLPLFPQELRAWNQMIGKDLDPSQLNSISMRLLMIANEFGQVKWSASTTQRFVEELRAFQNKIVNAAVHEVLGVEQNATLEELKKVFFELLKKFHPDRLSSEHPPEIRRMSEQVFAKINEAYATMTDPDRRREHEAAVELEKKGGEKSIHAQLEAEDLLVQAKMALKRRHFKAALDLYHQIEKVIPNDAEVMAEKVYSELMTLANAKEELTPKLASFRDTLNKSLELKKNFASAFYYRGLVSKFGGEVNQALQDFERASQMDPRLSEAVSEARLIRMRKEKGSASGAKKK